MRLPARRPGQQGGLPQDTDGKRAITAAVIGHLRAEGGPLLSPRHSRRATRPSGSAATAVPLHRRRRVHPQVEELDAAGRGTWRRPWPQPAGPQPPRRWSPTRALAGSQPICRRRPSRGWPPCGRAVGPGSSATPPPGKRGGRRPSPHDARVGARAGVAGGGAGAQSMKFVGAAEAHDRTPKARQSRRPGDRSARGAVAVLLRPLSPNDAIRRYARAGLTRGPG